MRNCTANYTAYGKGHLHQRGPFFHQIISQYWSPLMHEITESWGIELFGFSISISRHYKQWLDDKLPTWTKGRY